MGSTFCSSSHGSLTTALSLQRKLAHSFIAIIPENAVVYVSGRLGQKRIWCHVGMAWMLGTYLMP